MTLQKLDHAIDSLGAAKRSAEAFNWPQSAIERIDLLYRAAIAYRDDIREGFGLKPFLVKGNSNGRDNGSGETSGVVDGLGRARS